MYRQPSKALQSQLANTVRLRFDLLDILLHRLLCSAVTGSPAAVQQITFHVYHEFGRVNIEIRQRNCNEHHNQCKRRSITREKEKLREDREDRIHGARRTKHKFHVHVQYQIDCLQYRRLWYDEIRVRSDTTRGIEKMHRWVTTKSYVAVETRIGSIR